MSRSNLIIYAVLIGAIFIISFAAILIKLADAPALVIATYRLAVAMLMLAPVTLARGRQKLQALSRKDLLLSLLSGVFLSVHFFTWISSLKYTSVASSVVLVSTNPIFVGLGSYFILKERLRSLLVLGIITSIAGGVLIGWGDFTEGKGVLYGDILALVGAMAASGYLLIGRRVRQKTDLLTYIFVVYGMAALVLLIASFITGQKLSGYSKETYLMFFLLALGPQLLGHTSFNWALKYVSPSLVAVATLGEPVGSTILAYFILSEGLTLPKALGSILVIIGIYLAARAEKRTYDMRKFSHR